MLQNGQGGRKRRVISAVTRQCEVGRVPVIPVCQSATLEQMDQVGAHWPEAHLEADEMAELAGAAYSVLGMDAVRVPFCQTVEAEALGCEVKSGGSEHVPGIATHPVSAGQILTIPDDLLSRGRLPVVMEAVRKLKLSLGDKVAIIGGVVGPFTLAGSLLGTKVMLIQAMKNPGALAPILDVCQQVGTSVAGALVEAGADIICVEDMAASPELISPSLYVGLVYPHHRRLFAGIKVPAILHICGDVSSTVEQMASTGAAALSYEGKIHKSIVESGVRDRVALITGPDPASTLATETPDDVERQCLDILELGVDILAPGCAVATSTPSENLLAMGNVVERYCRHWR